MINDTPLDLGQRQLMKKGCLFMPIAMLVVGLVVNSIGPDEWVAIEAEVLNTSIEFQSTGGPPEWGLVANFSYRVGDEEYTENSHTIFSDLDQDIVHAEQNKWPTGRTLIIYYHPDDPRQSSLAHDGGREGWAVAGVLLTPMVIMAFVLIVFFIRQSRQQKLNNPPRS